MLSKQQVVGSLVTARLAALDEERNLLLEILEQSAPPAHTARKAHAIVKHLRKHKARKAGPKMHVTRKYKKRKHNKAFGRKFKKGTHWMQKPENRERVQAMAKMRAAKRKSSA